MAATTPQQGQRKKKRVHTTHFSLDNPPRQVDWERRAEPNMDKLEAIIHGELQRGLPEHLDNPKTKCVVNRFWTSELAAKLPRLANVDKRGCREVPVQDKALAHLLKGYSLSPAVPTRVPPVEASRRVYQALGMLMHRAALCRKIRNWCVDDTNARWPQLPQLEKKKKKGQKKDMVLFLDCAIALMRLDKNFKKTLQHKYGDQGAVGQQARESLPPELRAHVKETLAELGGNASHVVTEHSNAIHDQQQKIIHSLTGGTVCKSTGWQIKKSSQYLQHQQLPVALPLSPVTRLLFMNKSSKRGSKQLCSQEEEEEEEIDFWHPPSAAVPMRWHRHTAQSRRESYPLYKSASSEHCWESWFQDIQRQRTPAERASLHRNPWRLRLWKEANAFQKGRKREAQAHIRRLRNSAIIEMREVEEDLRTGSSMRELKKQGRLPT
jgi:hypothetical protein